MTDRRRPFAPPNASQLVGIRQLLEREALRRVVADSSDEELDALDWLELCVLGSAEKCLPLTIDGPTYSDLVELLRQGLLIRRRSLRRDGRERDQNWVREILTICGVFDQEAWELFVDRSRMKLSYLAQHAFIWGRAYERWRADDLRSGEARCEHCNGKGYT
jgi:hypothetical protein